MKSVFLFFLLFCLAVPGFCQTADFIVLKKKGKTVHSWYEGVDISFVTTGGAYRNGLVSGISNDSIQVKEFVVRNIPTTYGTFIRDTAGSLRYLYHYKEISHVDLPRKRGFNLQVSGASLMGGGILLVLGSGVVYLADRSKYSPELMIGALALTGIGYLLNKLSSRPVIAGKRGYSLQYISIKP